MKASNRFFFLTLLAFFLSALLANSCDSDNEDGSLEIWIAPESSNVAKIVSENGLTTIRILETAIGNNGTATANTFESYESAGALRAIFVVSMKKTSKGLLFAADRGQGVDEIKNIDQMSVPFVAASAATVPPNSQSFFINANPAKIISTWLTRGFDTATPAGGNSTSIGFLCQTTFSQLSKDSILQETPQDLSGGDTATCLIGATQNLSNGGWVAASSQTSIHLVFGGFNTMDRKTNQLGQNVDITNGILRSEIKTLRANFPNSILNVKVEVVSSL